MQPNIHQNPYKILGIDPNADQTIIETAYRRMALRYHPDLNPAREATLVMQQINEAYTLLRQSQKRAELDRQYNPRTAPTSSRRPASPPRTAQPQYTAPKAEPRVQLNQQEQLVVFYLNDEPYGFTVQDILSVSNAPQINPHPHAPDFVEGIILVRGEKTPLVDLRKHLGMPTIPVSRETRTLLIRVQDAQVGLMVDSIENFLSVPSAITIHPPSFPFNQDMDFVKGFARIGFQLVILLNLNGLFSQQQGAYLSGFYHYLQS